MTPHEALAAIRSIVDARNRHAELVARGCTEDERIEAVDDCDIAVESADFAAILGAIEPIINPPPPEPRCVPCAEAQSAGKLVCGDCAKAIHDEVEEICDRVFRGDGN